MTDIQRRIAKVAEAVKDERGRVIQGEIARRLGIDRGKVYREIRAMQISGEWPATFAAVAANRLPGPPGSPP